jgi:hypothetical protein
MINEKGMSGCGAVDEGKVIGLYFGDEEPLKNKNTVVFDHWMCSFFFKDIFEKLNVLSEQVSIKNEAYACLVPASSIIDVLERGDNLVIKRKIANGHVMNILGDELMRNFQNDEKEIDSAFYLEMKNDAIEALEIYKVNEEIKKRNEEIKTQNIAHVAEMKNIKNNNHENELLFTPNVYISDHKYEEKNFKNRSWFFN